ncbi:MAG: glycosyltransferase family 4 protein [Candidatus Bathyarchaeota archaeon]|nr:glycosyltransferase family 4 protein [Candidatus Bathyarchaeota archaeon]
MKKLRLAVFNTQPPLFLGGVERRILETSKRLKNEVTTTIYSGTKAGLKKITKLNDVTLIPLFSTDKLFPLDNWTFNQTLKQKVNSIKADVYEVHTASGYGLIGAFKKNHIKAATVQTIHGVLADEYVQANLRGDLSLRFKLANLFMRQLAKKEEESAKNATLIVTISEYSKKKILEHYNVDPTKIRLVPNGVDTDRFKPSGNCSNIRRHLKIGTRPVVLSVGRLIPRKGLGYLVQAAKTVVLHHKNTLFLIVGNGPLKKSLIKQVKTEGLTGNFAFLGDVSENDLAELYRCADVFAFPSIQEGQGIALLEAQATAKPVVAFNVSGVVEAVRAGQTALLVKPGNSDAFAEGILKLLADENLKSKMGLAGREFVCSELSWDVCAKKMLQVYHEAIESV